MKKLIVSSVLVVMSMAAVAVVKSPKPAPTIAERKAAKAAREAAALREDGGEVIRPGSMQGWILIGNAQTRVDPYILEETRDLLWDALNFDIRVQKTDAVDFSSASSVLAKSGAAAAVFVVDDPKLPIVLLAPEDHWGILNLAPLARDAKTQKYVEMRTMKELMRAFAGVCGGSASSYSGNTLVGAIRKPSDLDGIARLEYPMDVLMRFNAYMKRLGVTPAERAPYSFVVYEDWCPPPANEWQKRIKDQIESDKAATAKSKALKAKSVVPSKPAAK